MGDQDSGITVANDETICSLVRLAQRRLVVLAPAVSRAIALAIAEKWKQLGPNGVNVILDLDPEVFRLGYGDFEAIAILDRTAAELGAMLQRQKGVRIGLIISDDATLVYSPTPQLVEAGPVQGRAANAILLGTPPPQVEKELGQGKNGVRDQVLGLEKATRADVAATGADLIANPPMKFNIARTVRVFSTVFEFVDFELRGTFIDRKTVSIPKHLSGIADAKTREQFRQSFTILPPDHKLSGAHLDHDKKLIVRKYLRQLKDYGTVLLRSQKEAFLKDIEKLKANVAAFGQKIQDELQQEMDKNRATLVKAMLPLVKRRPPAEWVSSDGVKPDAETMRYLLDEDLRSAFGTAQQLVQAMEVRVVVKGITWEMLTDPDFMAAVKVALPECKKLYDEFDAAKAAAQPQEVAP